MGSYRREISAAALLGTLATLAYWGTLAHDFVNYDDPEYVVNNPYVARGLTREGWDWAWHSTHGGNWHPLTWLSWQVDAQMGGMSPRAFHRTNALLHAANVILLFVALRSLSGAVWRSAFVAALFGLHPLHVESVAWVSERKDVLSMFFGMAALLAYATYARRRSIARYLLVASGLTLSLLSKPMLVTLPCVLLLLDLWPLGRWRHEGEGSKEQVETVSRDERSRKSGKDARGLHPGVSRSFLQHPSPLPPHPSLLTPHQLRLIAEKLPLFALSALFCAVALSAQASTGAMLTSDHLPLAARAANATVAYAVYLRKAVWPADLAIPYPHLRDQLSTWQITAAALVLAMITLAAIGAWRRAPYLAVGWFWYLGTLVPVIGLVQVGDQALADRYTYFPLIGIFIAVVWGVADLAVCWRFEKPAMVTGGLV